MIPEYTFMDPRAIGKWDMLRISLAENAIWALDANEAGTEGRVSEEVFSCNVKGPYSYIWSLMIGLLCRRVLDHLRVKIAHLMRPFLTRQSDSDN